MNRRYKSQSILMTCADNSYQRDLIASNWGGLHRPNIDRI